jgi:hypothetical protein
MSSIRSRPRDAGSPAGLRTFHSRRFRLLVAVVLATLGLALNWVYLQVLWDSPTPWLEDFEPYYGAAERMLAGELPYTEAQLEAPVDAVCPGCYLYPPFLAQISAPLSVVPMEMAKVGWFAVLSAAAFASTWIASGTAGARPTLERAAWCVAAVTFFFPVFHSNWLGNVGSQVALSLATTVRAASVLAGVLCVGASAWLARKPGGLPAAVVLATVTMFVVPGTLWYHYLAVLLPIAAMAWVRAGVPARLIMFLSASTVTIGGTMQLPVSLAGAAALLVTAGWVLWPRQRMGMPGGPGPGAHRFPGAAA